MTSSEADLAYIASAIRRRSACATPWPVAVMYAVYVAVGYGLIDWRPQYASLWFLVAGCVLGGASWWVGKHWDAREGDHDSARDTRLMLHWGSIFLALGGFIAIANMQHMQGIATAQITTLIIGLVYYLAGAHFDRRYIPLGLMFMVGAVAGGLVDHWVWTATGLSVGIGLILLAFLPRKTVTL